MDIEILQKRFDRVKLSRRNVELLSRVRTHCVNSLGKRSRLGANLERAPQEEESFLASQPQDRKALDDLFSLCYEELRRLASVILRSEHAARVTPTTLVNEVWLKLAPNPSLAQTSPLHFRRIAARAMRQVLVDLARRRLSQVHGGEYLHVSFDETLGLTGSNGDAREVMALDCALTDLGKMSARQLALVEARFFGGLNNEECAELLQCSEATLIRDWRAARAWLAREVRRALTEESGSRAHVGSSAGAKPVAGE
jgi:RNA polymerase sigma-70 factor, ECF subfamily